MKKHLKPAIISLLCLALVFVGIVAAANVVEVNVTKDNLISVDEAADIGDADYILILGCGVKPDGTPSDMLRDRLRRGCEIYDACGGKKILLSGDGARDGYDEITPMINFCLEHGVREEDIIADRYGVSTRISVKRARDEFGAKKLVIVTQEYHLYRAMFIARRYGLPSFGVGADLHSYSGQTFRDVREVIARAKDFVVTLFIK